MITVRPARISDSAAIGAVHVAAWRSTYPGILPDAYLARLSPTRLARHYEAAIAAGGTVIVAAQDPGPPRVIGFTTAGRARRRAEGAVLGDGEVETLYVLDDWREQGLGRALLHAAARELAAQGCRSAFLWVLADNPSRFFYRHLGGQEAAHGVTRVAGLMLPQAAYAWDPIDRLLAASPAP